VQCVIVTLGPVLAGDFFRKRAQNMHSVLAENGNLFFHFKLSEVADMETYVAGVIGWAFFCFAFVAEQLNPFAKPKNFVRRSQWRYGRRVGGSALGFGAFFLLLTAMTPVTLIVSLILCGVLFAVSWVLISRVVQANEAF